MFPGVFSLRRMSGGLETDGQYELLELVPSWAAPAVWGHAKADARPGSALGTLGEDDGGASGRQLANLPVRQRHLDPVVGIVVQRIPPGGVDLTPLERLILGVDPHAVLVPKDDLIALVAGDVQHRRAEVGMTIVREHRNAPEM